MTTGNRNVLRKSGFADHAKVNEIHGLSPKDLGQNCPQDCPQIDRAETDADPFGEPLSITRVARLIGCSEWTVRQRYIPAGLPCIRLGPAGKIIFYRKQVIRWLLMQQEKGGTIQ